VGFEDMISSNDHQQAKGAERMILEWRDEVTNKAQEHIFDEGETS